MSLKPIKSGANAVLDPVKPVVPPKANTGRFSKWTLPIGKTAFFLLLACSQALFIYFRINLLATNDSELTKGPNRSTYLGHILVIGDTRGLRFGCLTCESKKEFLPRLSRFLRTYESPLVLDAGGFTASQDYEASIAVYKAFYSRINVAAINLTKRDYNNITDFENLEGLPLISSDIITNDATISPYRSLVLTLEGKMGKKEHVLNVVSLTDNDNYPKPRPGYTIDSDLVALSKISQGLKGDTVMLYYNSEYSLERLLKRITWPELRFAIGCYRGTVSKAVRTINNIPYAYIGESSNTVGHIAVRRSGHKTNFDFDVISYYGIFREDTYIRNILELSR